MPLAPAACSFEVTVTSVSLPPFVSRRGLSNTNQRLSHQALKLRSLPFTHPVYVASRYFQLGLRIGPRGFTLGGVIKKGIREYEASHDFFSYFGSGAVARVQRLLPIGAVYS